MEQPLESQAGVQDAVANFEYCLAHELHRGHITPSEAEEARIDFEMFLERNKDGSADL